MLTYPSIGDAPLNTLIHPTAVVHPKAEIHPTVRIDPYAVIGEKVTIGAHTTVGSHVIIEGPTEIGEHNRIFPGAVIGLEPQDLKYKGGDSWVKIGNNNQIREYVTINRATDQGEATILGNNNLLMAYAHVAHNCIIEDEVIIANSVALAGHIYIESKARISGVLGVHQFVHIGSLAFVAGMSRIEKDVPPYTIVEGNPSKVRSLNLVGLKRAGLSTEEFDSLKKAFRLLYRSEITFKEALEKLEVLPHNEYTRHLHHFLQLSISGEGRRGPISGSKS
jgi:UDP-N-acetylglucosamine acyltransferase